MMRKILVVLLIGVIAYTLFACNTEQAEQEPLEYEADIMEMVEVDEAEDVAPTSLPINEMPEDTGSLQTNREPHDTMNPQKQTDQASAAELKIPVQPLPTTNPRENTASQTPNPTAPATSRTPESTQAQSRPPGTATTPAQGPTSDDSNSTTVTQPPATPPPPQTPEPESPPAPPPTVVEPPPARTICNICEADITGNVAAHGATYLLTGENFSYRVE